MPDFHRSSTNSSLENFPIGLTERGRPLFLRKDSGFAAQRDGQYTYASSKIKEDASSSRSMDRGEQYLIGQFRASRENAKKRGQWSWRARGFAASRHGYGESVSSDIEQCRTIEIPHSKSARSVDRATKGRAKITPAPLPVSVPFSTEGTPRFSR